MKLHIVIPPYALREGKKAVRPNKAMLPTGALTFAASLQRVAKCEVTVSHLVFHEDWDEHLPDSKPEILGIHCHTRRNVPVIRQILEALTKRFGSLPHTIFGGNFCTEQGIDYLAKWGIYPNAVIRGFAHGADVIDAVLSRKKGDIYPDPAYLTGNLPVPALNLLDEETHKQYLHSSDGWYPMYVHVLGCSYGCDYCESRIFRGLKERDYDLVVDEIGKAVNQLGYSRIWAVDNLSLTDPKRSLKLDQYLYHMGLTWRGMSRPEIIAKIRPGQLKKFRALKEIAMGIESLNENALKVLNRGSRRSYAETVQVAVTNLNSGKINSNGFWMLGIPGEPEDVFWKNFKKLQALGLKNVSWSFYNPTGLRASSDIPPERFGFYNWPISFGAATLNPFRLVQQAMILSGIWWKEPGWHLDETDPFFEDGDYFGVNFLEGQIFQHREARSPIGDLWKVWEEIVF